MIKRDYPALYSDKPEHKQQRAFAKGDQQEQQGSEKTNDHEQQQQGSAMKTLAKLPGKD